MQYSTVLGFYITKKATAISLMTVTFVFDYLSSYG